MRQMSRPWRKAALEAGSEEAKRALIDLEADLASTRRQLTEISETIQDTLDVVDSFEDALDWMIAAQDA